MLYMTFSADASINIIIHSYLQPFELACITGEHTKKTYENATEYGSTDYIKKYKHLYQNLSIPLHVAAQYGQLEAIKLLIDLGAKYFDIPLRIAAQYGQLEAIKLLLDLGTGDREVALYYAAEFNQLNAIILLVERGATCFNWALVPAARNKHLDAVKLLLRLGADEYQSAFICAQNISSTKAIEMVKLIQFYRNKRTPKA